MDKFVGSKEKNIVETTDIFLGDQHKQAISEDIVSNKTYDGIFIGINSAWNPEAKIYATVKVDNKIISTEIGYEDKEFLQRHVPIGSRLTVEINKNKWRLSNLNKSGSDFHRNIVINTLDQPEQ